MIPAIPDARNVPLLLCQERFNEANLSDSVPVDITDSWPELESGLWTPAGVGSKNTIKEDVPIALKTRCKPRTQYPMRPRKINDDYLDRITNQIQTKELLRIDRKIFSKWISPWPYKKILNCRLQLSTNLKFREILRQLMKNALEAFDGIN